MESIPNNKEVGLVLGLDEDLIKKYRQETYRLKDGSWLVHFAYWMPAQLR